MDLRATCLTGIDTKGTVLEIGPLNRPIVRGENVYYADHCSTPELRMKYALDPNVNSDDIVDVHFDLSSTSIESAGRNVGGFDLVVASHVIEHVPDLAGWLRSINSALKPNGVLALVIPDKNYTFDIFRRETERWMIDDARGLTRPSLRQVLDHFLNVVAADTGALWKSPNAKADFRPAIGAEAIEGLISQHGSGAYIDAHCWVFTPERFASLINHAFPGFQIQIFPTRFGQLEFYAQLRKSPYS